MSDYSPLSLDDYAGLLDDVVSRYPWDLPVDGAALEHMLVERFLFGRRLFINDGYLVSSPALLEAVADPTSLLNRQLAAGWVRIVAARSPISASILERARSGVATQALLTGGPEWPEISRLLDDLTARCDTIVPWPDRDLTFSFAALARAWMERREQRSDDPICAFAESFLAQLAADPGAPRTKWEALVIEKSRTDERLRRDAMMQAANQIYHLNFAAALVLARNETMTVSTWLNDDMITLLNAEHLVRDAKHDAPVLVMADGAARELIEQVQGEPAFMALRARYLRGWQNKAVARAYASALRAMSSVDGTEIRPSALVDPEKSMLHLWNEQEIAPNGSAARILITPSFAWKLIGDGPPI